MKQKAKSATPWDNYLTNVQEQPIPERKWDQEVEDKGRALPPINHREERGRDLLVQSSVSPF